jgi:segregation and condensation protein A
VTDDEIPLNIAGHNSDDSRAGDAKASPAREDGGSAVVDPPSGSGEGQPSGSADGQPSRPGEGPTGPDDEEVEPVELLVQLAEDGDIDPWDIDIVEVTDKFLARLDDSDLRTSGRALFYASVLLRMKSDVLLEPDEPEEPEPDPWEEPFADDPGMDAPLGFDPVNQLEEEMERRLERKSVRGSPQTLDELVHELRDAERGSWWKESRSYDTSGSPRGFSRGTQTLDYRTGDDMRMSDEPTEDDVTHTTHDEQMEDVIERVYAALREQYEQGREEVLYAEIQETGGSKVMTFLALLFLANRDFVRLAQDDLFGDLWIRQVSTAAGEPTVDAVAD